MKFESFDRTQFRMTGFGDNEQFGFFCIAGFVKVEEVENSDQMLFFETYNPDLLDLESEDFEE